MNVANNNITKLLLLSTYLILKFLIIKAIKYTNKEMNRVIIFTIAPNLADHIRSLMPQLEIIEIKADKTELFTHFNDAEIIIADCASVPKIADQLSSIKWIQSTSAGVEPLLPLFSHKENTTKNQLQSCIVTRFVDDVYGLDMAEYIVAQIVNHERKQWEDYENQKLKIWTAFSMFKARRLIGEMTIGIMGLGNLGKSVAKVLKMFGATIWALTRTKNPTTVAETAAFVDHHLTNESLAEFLAHCDYVICILPATPATNGLLDGNVLENCKERKTILVNVGRGNIISEDCLINAIEKQWISAAILDVVPIEPLPKSNRLWDIEQITITPHNACSVRPRAIAELFVKNYQKFIKGESLPNTVDFKRGY